MSVARGRGVGAAAHGGHGGGVEEGARRWRGAVDAVDGGLQGGIGEPEVALGVDGGEHGAGVKPRLVEHFEGPDQHAVVLLEPLAEQALAHGPQHARGLLGGVQRGLLVGQAFAQAGFGGQRGLLPLREGCLFVQGGSLAAF